MKIDWDRYHTTMSTLRDTALSYTHVHEAQGPDRNLAWHNLLEAAVDYAAARRNLLDGIAGAPPRTPPDT